MLLYILKVSLCWFVLYGFYYLFLRKETFFSVNRIYLLSTLCIGAIIPLLDGFLPGIGNEVITYYIAPIDEQIISVNESLAETSYLKTIDWSAILFSLYIVGLLIAAIKFILSISKLIKIYRTAEVQNFSEYRLVKTNFYHLPFSFFNLIFWSNDYRVDDSNKHKITTHELAHIRGAHSVDSILLELFSIIFWCSPFVYLYKMSLKNVHEYLADDAVLRTNSTQLYGNFLLNQKQIGSQLNFANHLINSQLKNRIIMMTKDKSNQKNIIKYLLAVPLCLVLFLYCSKGDLDSEITYYNAEVGERSSTNTELDKSNVTSELEAIISNYDSDSKDNLALRRSYTVEINNQIAKYPEHAADIRSSANALLLESRIPWLVATMNSPDNTDVIEISNEMMEKMISKIGEGIMADDIKLESNDIQLETSDEKDVYKVVDEMPRFPGCNVGSQEEMKTCAQQKMLNYIYTNIKYPANAIKDDVQGTTVVRFIVRKDGSLTDIESVRKIGGGCDEESIRVVRSMPKWIPGKQAGQAVDVQFNLPIKYKLAD